ncbi:LysR family transcriptional regulator [Ruania alkalisoli]|uniref:LysR family transcriptional regulator n=1 Tax=Ruania alkalisoli TaxID=2779775 RepID=A0A7M1SU62_9MICO|nr:LysR family transcriptional regulator [Ruania alkalisoli]QOR71116.1 LysR family transcriptional regulator [Ruania alkalisoli]
MSAHEQLQLSWLRAFLAVHNKGSFTAAAAHVHRAQSRVSGQIAQLERHLGAQLFIRDTRPPVRLTEAGQDFLPYAQAVLQEVEAGVSAVASRDGVVRGRVRVASFPGAALVLAPLIKQFTARHPNARVELIDALGHSAEHFVLHNDVDLAVRATEPVRIAQTNLLGIAPLFREPITCLLPNDHPCANAPRVPPSVFTGESVIMTGQPDHETGHFSALLTGCGVRPAEEIVVGQPTTVAAMACAGLGLGILPALAARLLDTQGRVRLASIDGSEWVRSIVVVTHRARQYPHVVAAFVDALKACQPHPDLLQPDDAGISDRPEPYEGSLQQRVGLEQLPDL